MPARNEHGNKTKKKKGRAPAHQNKFAYKHNPCSKKTEKILSLPNIHACQRCHDKIEWRKQYRKYKPRTQPGTCNLCKRRNVKAAYHTICTKCTTESAKAKQLIEQAKRESPEISEDDKRIIRACAVCVKVIALPDPEEEEDDRDYVDAMSRLNLRQRRALERKIAKEKQEAEEKEKGRDADENETENESGDDDEEGHQPQRPLETLSEEDMANDFDVAPDYGDDEDDPFLKAIGGADKLLTGEAYQQKLLAQQNKKQ